MITMFSDLFRIGSGSISVMLTARVAVAVGVPLLGFLLAGRPLAAVVAAATAMFVTLSDIGNSAKERGGTMLLATFAMLGGGFIGARFGGTTYADEAVVLVSALMFIWAVLVPGRERTDSLTRMVQPAE